MFRAVALTLAAFAASIVTTPARFTSARFGLSFDLPAHADVCRAGLPAAFVLFRPAGVTSPLCDDDIENGSRYTSVDARPHRGSATTTADFVTKVCRDMAYDSRGTVTRMSTPARLAGFPAAACRIDGADGSILEIVYVDRGGKGASAADYTLVLKTTRQDYAVDHAAFSVWLRTVKIAAR